MITVVNELTGQTFRTPDVRVAQAYRDDNETGVVVFYNEGIMIGESSARYLLRKAVAGRTVRLKRR
jgi:hypothetical protein